MTFAIRRMCGEPVQEINRTCHENGRYRDRSSVAGHFARYGFSEIRL
jgi:hypothetical protein